MCVCVCVCVYVRVHACMFGRVQLFSTPLAVARQAPLSMEFSRQEYWSRVPFSFSGDLRHPGIKLLFPASPAGGFFTTAPLLHYYRKEVNCLAFYTNEASFEKKCP